MQGAHLPQSMSNTPAALLLLAQNVAPRPPCCPKQPHRCQQRAPQIQPSAMRRCTSTTILTCCSCKSTTPSGNCQAGACGQGRMVSALPLSCPHVDSCLSSCLWSWRALPCKLPGANAALYILVQAARTHSPDCQVACGHHQPSRLCCLGGFTPCTFCFKPASCAVWGRIKPRFLSCLCQS